MYNTTQSVIQMAENKKAIWWKLHDKTGKNLLADCLGDCTTEVAIAQLKEVLQGLSNDYYTLSYKANTAPAAQAYHASFRNDVNAPQIAGINQPQFSALDIQMQINQGIAAAVQTMQLQNQIDRLQEQLKEQKKEKKPSVSESLMSAMVAKIAGINISETQQIGDAETAPDEAEKNLNAFIDNIKLAGFDANKVFATLSKLKPETLKNFIPLIETQI